MPANAETYFEIRDTNQLNGLPKGVIRSYETGLHKSYEYKGVYLIVETIPVRATEKYHMYDIVGIAWFDVKVWFHAHMMYDYTYTTMLDLAILLETIEKGEKQEKE